MSHKAVGNVYWFSISSGISLCTKVVADSLEKAIAQAQSRSVVSLCYHCAHGEPDSEWVTSGELDCGDPGDAELVEATCNGEDILEAAKACWERGK